MRTPHPALGDWSEVLLWAWSRDLACREREASLLRLSVVAFESKLEAKSLLHFPECSAPSFLERFIHRNN